MISASNRVLLEGVGVSLFLQWAVILAAARVCGMLLRWLGQPPVVGEMTAGMLLGPVVLGRLFPSAQAALFPQSSLAALDSLAQFGLVLFMFSVGAQLHAHGGVRAAIKGTLAVALASVAVPAALGIAITPLIYPYLAPPGIAFGPFAGFIAVALAVTAFPVLARILTDLKLADSAIGRLALSAAAVVDVLAWTALALVLAWVESGRIGMELLATLLGLGALIAVLLALRPVWRRLLGAVAAKGTGVEGAVLASVLIGVFACAAITDRLGLHTVFGAFIFGACLPRNQAALQVLLQRVQHVAVVALMPIFFVLAGFYPTWGGFAGGAGFALVLVLVAAVLGKVAGAAAGARIAGQPWRESLAVGALMNSRGLMELVAIKMGLDAGAISPEAFTILFVMTVLTTVMTAPLLALFAPATRWRQA
jgi:Kef-type K+ transport system membrane component KefB